MMDIETAEKIASWIEFSIKTLLGLLIIILVAVCLALFFSLFLGVSGFTGLLATIFTILFAVHYDQDYY